PRFNHGAQKRTRTSTKLPPLAPEASASTNSATWAGAARMRERVAYGNDAAPACQFWRDGQAACGVPFAHDQTTETSVRQGRAQVWRQFDQGHPGQGQAGRQQGGEASAVDAGDGGCAADARAATSR